MYSQQKLWKYALVLQRLSVYLSLSMFMEQFKHHLMDLPETVYWDVTLKLCLRIHIENLLRGNILCYNQFTWSDFFLQISTCTPVLISSVSLNMFLQAKSFNNRRFSEDVVHILCSLSFFHMPHSLWDNQMKGEKCATNFAQCLCFLTYFLPCVTSCQLSRNILFTSLLKYLQSVKGNYM